MQRRHVITALVLVAIILAGTLTAWRVWQRQARTALVLGAVPAMPDLSRWSPELPRLIGTTTAELFSAADARPVLARLAAIYHVNGFAAEAAQVLAALRVLDPANARWPYLLADLRLRSGDNAGAEQGVADALRLDPTYAPGWVRLGFLQTQREDLAAAHASYVRATTVVPDDVRAQFALLAFEARKRPGENTRERLRALSAAHPELGPPHELLAEMYDAAGDRVAAARERRLAANADRGINHADPWIDALAPFCHDPNRLNLIATAAYREGRWNEAEKLLSRALEFTPTDATLWIAWSGLCEKQGRLADARAVFERAVQACPYPALHVQLARLLGAERRGEDAIGVVRAALQRWPGDAGLHAALGFAQRDARRLPEAEAAFREAARLDPTSVEARYNLGWCLMQLGRRDDARAAVEEALVMRPDHPEALFFLGAQAVEDGDARAAAPHIARLHELRPDQPGTQQLFGALHLLRGRAALAAGDVASAEREFRAGLAGAPTFVPLLVEAGVLAMRREQYADAAAWFERYVGLDPADPRGYAVQGRAVQALGREAEAREIFRRGLDAARRAGQPSQIEELQRLLGP